MSFPFIQTWTNFNKNVVMSYGGHAKVEKQSDRMESSSSQIQQRSTVCVCVLNCCSLFKIENLALSQLKTPFLPSFHRSNLRFDNQSTCVVPSRKGTLFDGNRQHICHFGDVPVTAMLRSPSGREETCFISCLNMFYLVKNNICFSEEYVENSCRHWKQGERPFCSWIILWIALPESRYKNDDKN